MSKKRKVNAKRRRNKTFPEYLSNLINRIVAELENLYDEPGKNGRYYTTLAIGDATIPKDVYNEPSIKLSYLRNVVVPKLYGADVDDIYRQTFDDIYEIVINQSPDRNAIRSTARKSGFSIENIILEQIYNNLTVYVEIDGLAERSGIELIEDIENLEDDLIEAQLEDEKMKY